MSTSGDITVSVYQGVGITLLILAAGFVATRCFVSFQGPQHRLEIADWCSIVGLSFLIASYGVNHVVLTVTTGPVESIDLYYLQKIAVVIIIVAPGTLWFSKAPIIFLYLKLFGIHRWLRYVSWATLVVSFLVYTVGLIYPLVYCPVSRSKATFPDYQHCASANTLAGVFSGFVSVLVDLTLLILPTPVIIALEIDTYKKIGLGLTFFSAILGVVASVAALYYKWSALYGDGTHLGIAILCFTIEGAVAIMVGCAPALRSFWIRHITKSAVDGTEGSSNAIRHKILSDNTPQHTGWQGHGNFGDTVSQSNSYIRMEPR
ncbi:hypothetical protein KVR01_013813 [Diaporthe batatas]|uniref:uncharacterized protein n=1 Tax=Diaporthe batatas TaxID=748121 RepID=UPI001D05691D|nr:uncharacterized protein KVR01_013813 [Diaporthe batatas]KAG8156361.1 hypothetical protein KVR01_013813 [Diaporthe batatas]